MAVFSGNRNLLVSKKRTVGEVSFLYFVSEGRSFCFKFLVLCVFIFVIFSPAKVKANGGCIGRIMDADSLEECCDDKKRQLRDYWDCDYGCEELKAFVNSGVGSGSYSGGDLGKAIGKLSSCFKEAEYKKKMFDFCEETKNMSLKHWSNDCDCKNIASKYTDNEPNFIMNEIGTCTNVDEYSGDYTKKCGNAEVSTCCRDKKKLFEDFWPNSGTTIDQCDCSYIEVTSNTSSMELTDPEVDELNRKILKKNVVECIYKAEKRACDKKCSAYISTSMAGCSKAQKQVSCDNICNDTEGILNTNGSEQPEVEVYKNIENKISNIREACFREVTGDYKKECMNVIKKLQKKKKQTLICGTDGTLDEQDRNAQCEKYCEGKADEFFAENDDISQEIAIAVHRALNPPL